MISSVFNEHINKQLAAAGIMVEKEDQLVTAGPVASQPVNGSVPSSESSAVAESKPERPTLALAAPPATLEKRAADHIKRIRKRTPSAQVPKRKPSTHTSKPVDAAAEQLEVPEESDRV